MQWQVRKVNIAMFESDRVLRSPDVLIRGYPANVTDRKISSLALRCCTISFGTEYLIKASVVTDNLRRLLRDLANKLEDRDGYSGSIHGERATSTMFCPLL